MGNKVLRLPKLNCDLRNLVSKRHSRRQVEFNKVRAMNHYTECSAEVAPMPFRPAAQQSVGSVIVQAPVLQSYQSSSARKRLYSSARSATSRGRTHRVSSNTNPVTTSVRPIHTQLLTSSSRRRRGDSGSESIDIGDSEEQLGSVVAESVTSTGWKSWMKRAHHKWEIFAMRNTWKGKRDTVNDIAQSYEDQPQIHVPAFATFEPPNGTYNHADFSEGVDGSLERLLSSLEARIEPVPPVGSETEEKDSDSRIPEQYISL